MEHAAGVGLALVAALGFGGAAVFARMGMRRIRPTTATIASLVTSAAVTMAIALSLDASGIGALGAAAFGFLLLNAALSYLVGRLFNFTGVRLVGARLTAPILGGTVLVIIGVGVILSSRLDASGGGAQDAPAEGR